MSDLPQDLTPEDERDLLAAEFVIGLLDASAHAAAAGRVGADPAFAAAVEAWERRLTPLIAGLPPGTPSAELWARISAQLPRTYSERRSWWDSLTFWRAATGVAAAMAAALAVVVLVPDEKTSAPAGDAPPTLQPIMASTRMQTEAGQVLFVITFDQARNRVIVTSVAGDGGSADHSHELWMLPKDGAPVSLGILPSGGSHAMPMSVELTPDASLAVSVEPLGGSPTGLPTGPVVAQGQLTPL
jgi:anti-sigma-K factor RskA